MGGLLLQLLLCLLLVGPQGLLVLEGQVKLVLLAEVVVAMLLVGHQVQMALAAQVMLLPLVAVEVVVGALLQVGH